MVNLFDVMAFDNSKNLGDLTTGYIKEPKHLIALSGGGIDGFLSVVSAIKRFQSINDVTFLFFDYGQASRVIEETMVFAQAEYIKNRFMIAAGVEVFEDPMKKVLHIQDHALNSKDTMQRAHDGDRTVADVDIYIPNRNARFMTFAMGYADANDGDIVTLGAVGNVNLDNSLEFLQRVRALHEMSGQTRVGIYAPFVLYSKSIVPLYAASRSMLHDLRYTTVSCFFPMDLHGSGIAHCGVCRSCNTLKQGFKFAGVEDPYIYADDPKWRSTPVADDLDIVPLGATPKKATKKTKKKAR